jgi:hypothetical protein
LNDQYDHTYDKFIIWSEPTQRGSESSTDAKLEDGFCQHSHSRSSRSSEVGRAISASYVNLAVNGTNLNMQLRAGTNMKMSPARQMQRAMNFASFQKPASGVNGTDGQLSVSTITFQVHLHYDCRLLVMYKRLHEMEFMLAGSVP